MYGQHITLQIVNGKESRRKAGQEWTRLDRQRTLFDGDYIYLL